MTPRATLCIGIGLFIGGLICGIAYKAFEQKEEIDGLKVIGILFAILFAGFAIVEAISCKR